MNKFNFHKDITIVIVLYKETFELLSKTLTTINSFKKNLAKMDTKKGQEKNKALAVASCI